MANALDIIHTAQQQVGFVEGANNTNPYGEWYGMNNAPYCAMFVSWVFAQNNLSHLISAQTPKGFAYCPAGLAWFQRKGAVVNKYDGKTGDLVFYSFSGNGQADHIEIIVDASKDGITTVGGNTSPDHAITAAQANGNGVYLRHRPYLYVLAIVRPEYEVSLKPTTSIGTNKLVAGGVAGATALTGGGMAVTHNSTPAVTKPTTTFTAPAWNPADFPPKVKTAQEVLVEKALYKAGLIPKVAVDTAWTSTHIKAVKTFQKAHKTPQTGIVDKTTYVALMKELP
jgi:hypothetical protein